jgi:hypothetical protein
LVMNEIGISIYNTGFKSVKSISNDFFLLLNNASFGS